MGSIRVSRLSADFLEDTVKPFLKANNKSLSCLSDLVDSNAESEGTVIIALGNQRQENKNQEEEEEEEEDSKVLLKFFDFKNEKWIHLMKISRNGLNYCDIIAIENYVVLYNINCYDDDDDDDATKTIVYNLKTGKLSSSKIDIPKHNKLVVLDGRVYAIGLDCDDLSTKVLEDGDWKIGANMAMERPGASVVAHDGKIYAFGGEESYIDRAIQTAEVYDPVKDEWASIPPMFAARYGAGVVSLDEKIFVVGGYGDHYDRLVSGECYDPKTKIWTRIPNVNDVSGVVGAVTIDGALLVASQYLSNVIKRYSPNSKIWETVKVSNAIEDFQIGALCSLNKKYLSKNENMNNNK